MKPIYIVLAFAGILVVLGIVFNKQLMKLLKPPVAKPATTTVAKPVAGNGSASLGASETPLQKSRRVAS